MASMSTECLKIRSIFSGEYLRIVVATKVPSFLIPFLTSTAILEGPEYPACKGNELVGKVQIGIRSGSTVGRATTIVVRSFLSPFFQNDLLEESLKPE